MINTKWHGANVHFWIGCVEERDDSSAKDGYKLGRVRVRILGHHSEKLTENDPTGEGIPVDSLPWAYPISPITSAAMSGIGVSPTGVVEGTWVIGIAMDGASLQDLYYLGTLLGVPQEVSGASGIGFQDPNGKYPLNESNRHALKESDMPRLARNDKLPQVVKEKQSNREQSPKRTAKGKTFMEPSVPYASKYPFNHVRATESGHVEEYDDTSSKERIHWYHKKGTFREWHPNGDEVLKVVGDSYEFVLKDRNLWVKGDLNIAVDGDANIRAKNINVEADKNIDIKAYGKISMWAAKGIDITSMKNINVKAQYGAKISGGLGAVSMSSTTQNISISGLSVNVRGAVSASLTSAGSTTVVGPANQGSTIAKGVA